MNKQGWTYKTFGEMGSFLRGKSIQKADFVEKGLPCIHYGQIHTKFGVSIDKHLSEIPLELYNKSIIASHGDVIIAITSEDLEGSCKSTAWLGDYDIAVSSHAAVYKHNLNPKFIAYYLRSKSFYYEKMKYARGFKVMEIKPTDIERIPIPVPPIGEQERIVAELDLLQGIIEKKKEQLKAYDQLAQSIFYTMFGDPVTNEKGWNIKKLGDIGKIITGNTPSTRDERNYDSNDVCFFKPSDIAKDGISLLTESEFHVSTFAYNNARKLPKGSVLVTCIGIVGKVGILEIDAMCNQQINAIIPNKDVASVYVAYSVLSERKIIESIAHAPVVPIINKGEFSQLGVPIPPLSLQEEFAEKVEAIERQKALVQQSIEEVQTMFDCTMDKYFG